MICCVVMEVKPGKIEILLKCKNSSVYQDKFERKRDSGNQKEREIRERKEKENDTDEKDNVRTRENQDETEAKG